MQSFFQPIWLNNYIDLEKKNKHNYPFFFLYTRFCLFFAVFNSTIFAKFYQNRINKQFGPRQEFIYPSG